MFSRSNPRALEHRWQLGTHRLTIAYKVFSHVGRAMLPRTCDGMVLGP